MKHQFNNVYKGKKVFITGHTGFKGSWLSLWLSELGANVVGYSIDIPTQPSHFELLKLDHETVLGDIVDRQKLSDTMARVKPDIVFHLAAQPIVRDSYENPVETFATNVMGTVNVLESCRTTPSIKAIVNITSDKCYHNREWIWGYKEDDAMGGHDPYSASKGCAELVSNAYRNSFLHTDKYGVTHSTLLANARAGNVIGGGDWARYRLIPDIMRATSRNETVIIRNPHATRPWQHVLEPLSGYLHLGWKLLEGNPAFAENWNFGPNEESSLTVSEVIHHSQKHWDKIKHEVQEDPNNPHEANLLKLDSSKARMYLQWKPVWDSHKTFDKTVNWYKNFHTDASVTTAKDLGDYINDAKKLSVEWARV